MGVIRFEKEEDKFRYLDWRKENPDGFVLNINTWSSKTTTTRNIIHKADWCLSLDTPPTPNRNRPITSEHPKLCFTNIRELEAIMISNSLPYKTCGHCMKHG